MSLNISVADMTYIFVAMCHIFLMMFNLTLGHTNNIRVWQGCDDELPIVSNSQRSELAICVLPPDTVLACKGSRDQNPVAGVSFFCQSPFFPIPSDHLCCGWPPGS